MISNSRQPTAGRRPVGSRLYGRLLVWVSPPS